MINKDSNEKKICAYCSSKAAKNSETCPKCKKFLETTIKEAVEQSTEIETLRSSVDELAEIMGEKDE